MSRQKGYRGFAILVLAVAVLAGCGTPAPTCPSPQVEVVVNPAAQEVTVGQTVALGVDASGQELHFKWTALRGTLTDATRPAVIYTAPGTAGLDTVTVEVTGAAGFTTTKNVSFKVVPPPSPGITITAPLDTGQCPPTGYCDFEVRGTSSGVAAVPGWQVVLFLNPDPENDHQWFPQPQATLLSDGSWSVLARVGAESCNPTGDDFRLAAVALPSEQAGKVPFDFQALPENPIVQSNVVTAVTAYAPIPLDLSWTSVSSDPGAVVTLTQVTSASFSFDYDLRAAGWVLAIVPVHRDLSCIKNLDAVLSFSLVGAGEPNYFQVQLEDAGYSKSGWTSPRGGNVSTADPVPLDKLTPVRGTGLQWNKVRNILFIVSKEADGAGGRGTVTVRNLVLSP